MSKRLKREEDQEPPSARMLVALLDLHPYNDEDRAKYDDAAVLNEIRRVPELAKKRHEFTKFGSRYPLTMAVCLGASLEVVKLLCELSPPQAFREKNRLKGYTLLHYACKTRTSFEVTELLVNCYPSAVEMKSNKGWTPLHLASHGGGILEVVRFLAERFPAAMNMKTNYGQTPLMLAEEGNNESLDVVTLLKTLHALLCLRTSHEEVEAMLRESDGKGKWRTRVAPILRWRTAVLHKMGIHPSLMPTILERVGEEGRMETMFNILRDSMFLFEGKDAGGETSVGAVP